MKILTCFAVSALALSVAACDIDTSALKEIEETAAQAHATATEINSRSEQIQQAVDDPMGAVRGVVTANLSKVPTDQPGIYVLTDLQTGCQFLATYAADGTTVSSVAPRVEALPGGGTRQRCVPIPRARGEG
ncbi:MAG: hypothetical protein U1C75_07925 [Brevundimonas sp.]|nr:hypothetical protein [Brevundimonas sp.]